MPDTIVRGSIPPTQGMKFGVIPAVKKRPLCAGVISTKAVAISDFVIGVDVDGEKNNCELYELEGTLTDINGEPHCGDANMTVVD